MAGESKSRRARSALLAAAALVLVLAGVKAASEILLPVVFAVLLSITCAPAVRGLVRLRVPRAISVGVVMLVLGGILVGGSFALVSSAARFTERLPVYQEPFLVMVHGALAWLNEAGIPWAPELADFVDPERIVGLITQALGALINLVSRVALVLLYTTFILLELVQIEEKLEAAFADDVGVSRSLVEGSISVQRYLAIKTGASLVTGLLVGATTALMGLDFAVLWGMLAFALNYVPTIGSLIAAVPAVALALLQLGPGWAIALGLFYVAVNSLIGNFVEPRVLGRRLGLSPFVVILCLFFWGWMWGAAGMLLAVPMTVVVRLLLEASPETRWLAVLMGGVRETAEIRKHGGSVDTTG